MAVLAGAQLWNRTESDAVIAASDLGPNGVVVANPTYAACKFNNGINADGTNYANFPAACPAGISMFEHWWKPTHDHNDATIRRFIEMRHVGNNDRILTLKFWPSYSYGVFVFDNGIRRIQYRYSFAYNAGELHHVLIVINSAAGAHNRAMLYWDGVLQVPAAYTDDNVFTLQAAMDAAIGDPGSANDTGGPIDNLKIYDSNGVVADILANRETEGWPVDGGKRMVDGGVRSNMVDGSVLVN